MSGYKIIDLNNINLTNGNIESDTAELLKEIENTYQDKSYLIDNITIEGVERKAVFTELISIDKGYKMIIYDKEILIIETGYQVNDIIKTEEIQEELSIINTQVDDNKSKINRYLPLSYRLPNWKCVQHILTFFDDNVTTIAVNNLKQSTDYCDDYNASVTREIDDDNKLMKLTFINSMLTQVNQDYDYLSVSFLNRLLYNGCKLSYELPYNHLIIDLGSDENEFLEEYYPEINSMYFITNINYCDETQDLIKTYTTYNNVLTGGADSLPLDHNYLHIIINNLEDFNTKYRLVILTRIIASGLSEVNIFVIPKDK